MVGPTEASPCPARQSGELSTEHTLGVDIASGAQLNDDANGIDRNPRQCPTDVF
jgi:hypothetical protein